MDNLRATIEVLFMRGNVELVLDELRYVEPSKKNFGPKERFVAAHQNDFPRRYNDDQTENIYKFAENKWLLDPDNPQTANNTHPIHAPLHFAIKALRELNDQPVCQFEHLLRWRCLALKLGEDLFTTAYLAYSDTRTARKRCHFGWPSMVQNDNTALIDLFRRQKLSELHAHLKGSSQVFDLNWLALMNHPQNQAEAFKQIKKHQLPDVLLTPGEARVSLRSAVTKAAAIRAMLFEKLCIPQGEQQGYVSTIKETDEKSLLYQVGQLQRRIDYLKWQYGHAYGEHIIDYAIPKNLPRREVEQHLAPTIHHGERKLLYTAFRYIWGRQQEDWLEIRQYLYAYLIAKSALRKELVQVNNRIGFRNFQTYENRKELFLPRESIYERLIANLAIHSTLAPGNVEYIEARLSPSERCHQLVKSIEYNDRNIDYKHFRSLGDQSSWPALQSKTDSKHHYVLHFIKRAEESNENSRLLHLVQCRHHLLRKKVKQQTFALNELRKSSHSARHRVVGIDAASSEIGCRPEVFATPFRYIKYYSHNPVGQYIYPNAIFRPLGITYHVGEDFLDIADGLRAVDEAIHFLNLGVGDRIGHGIVLGIDPLEYYANRKRTISMPAHDFLDNMAWLLNVLPLTSGVLSQTLMRELEHWFYEEFERIYGHHNLANVTPYHYYQAWKLRGDDPVHYKTERGPTCKFTNFWSKVGINDQMSEYPRLQKGGLVAKLYHLYHYDPQSREQGSQMVEKELSLDYINAMAQVQQLMRRRVAEHHITIEVNPSSNDVIGEFKRYDRHPLLQFYKNGLGGDNDTHCEQIHIVIGTDDQGVFATGLEQEFGLMALSLEKACDAYDQPLYKHAHIIEWLERIARMGVEHRFRSQRLT